MTAVQAAAPTNAPINTPAPLHPAVYQDTTWRPPAPQTVYVYDQKPVAANWALVTAEQAQAVTDRFKTAYSRINQPRLVVAINQGITNVSTNAVVGGLSLADRQTHRDIERMFGRPFRAAGATLVDQNVAAQVLGNKPLSAFLAAPGVSSVPTDRETLAAVADAVVEVLISPKLVTAPGLSGDVTFAIPDIQATATRLKDAKVIGQATSADVVTRVPAAVLRNFGVREITEATALVLMEDMSKER